MVFVVIGSVCAVVIVGICAALFSKSEKKMVARLFDLEKAGNYTEAIHVALRLIDGHPNSAGYHLRLAQLYEKNKNLAMTLSIYKQMYDKNIISSSVTRLSILENILRLTVRSSNYEEAFRVAYEVLRISNGNSAALTVLGRIHGSQGDLQTGQEMFDTALRNDPRNADAHLYYALTLLDLGDLRKALVELETALKCSPADRNVIYFLACAYLQSGQTDKAAMMLSKIGIEGFDNLPKNVLKIGILKQNMPKMDLELLKNQIRAGVGAAGGRAKNLDELLKSSGEQFHVTVLKIIERLDCSVREEIKDETMDPNAEKNFLCVTRGSSKPVFTGFFKAHSDLGVIPVAAFLQRMEEQGLKNGVLITTARLSPAAAQELQKERGVSVIDRSKIGRYLR